jgi:hypothetical protein
VEGARVGVSTKRGTVLEQNWVGKNTVLGYMDSYIEVRSSAGCHADVGKRARHVIWHPAGHGWRRLGASRALSAYLHMHVPV